MKNLKNVLQEFSIQIPIIQRDYAQGRINKKATKIRTDFINSIFDILSKSEKLHLDFIYGSIRENIFYPLDGQQRLTTLFLLYLYFGKKQNREIDYLEKFTYETRTSSRNFCNKLIKSSIDFSQEKIIQQIEDSNWFIASWENDPTIKAMLNMLEHIHSKFQNFEFYDNLDNITFNFFKLEDFGLDDDLYIKMNARGKSLTEFENFKAKFEKYLTNIDSDLQKGFAQNIDNKWTDYFWKFGVDNKTFLIDDFFMRFFFYVTEMLYYKKNAEILTEDFDFKLFEKIYDKENIKFLFAALDKIPEILESTSLIFSKNEYEIDKVCLFENETNLLEQVIIGKNLNISHKILLFLIINHFATGNLLNSELKELIRVARNLMIRIRHLKQGYINYTNDLSFENVYYLINIFLKLTNQEIYNELTLKNIDISKSGINKMSINHEIEKAKRISTNLSIKNEICRLEDFRYLKGDITYFLSTDESELSYFNSALQNIFSETDDLIIRSLLTIGDYKKYIGWSILGYKYYFGKNNSWEIILTPNNLFDIENIKRYSDFFKNFIVCYKTNSNSLTEMINSFVINCVVKDWRYYFIKYEEMLKDFRPNDNNTFAWKNGFEMEKMGGSNLNAYHTNPYINTIAKKLNKEQNFVQFDEYSFLKYKKLIIYCYEDGWHIYKISDDIFQKQKDKFNLIQVDDYFVLNETGNFDRIEILIELINEIKTANIL